MNTPLNLFATLRTAPWRAGTVALAICCGVAGAYIVTSQVTPTYQARASVVLVYASSATPTRPATARNPAGTGNQAAAPAGQGEASGTDLSALQAMVPTVAHLAESTNVALAAADSVHLPHDQVVGRVSADYAPGDTIITLTAAAPTPTAASAMANAVADVVHDQVSHGRMVLGRGDVLTAEPLDRASPPATPSTPKPELNLALGGMAGLLAGVAAVALGAQSDTGLHTATQIEAELGLTVLGTIPRTRRRTRGGARKALRRRRTAASVRAAVAALSPLAGLPGRRLLVTCPTTCDPKTSVAALLGLGFAEQELRVTLIDTELGRPRLAKQFPDSAAVGLQRLLDDDDRQPPASQQMLHVVPAEAVSPARRRTLLTSPRFRALVDAAISRCDVVVLNGPAVLAGADLSALVGQVDCAILVVTSGATRISEARSATQILGQFDIPVAGVVVANAYEAGGAAVHGATGQRRIDSLAWTVKNALSRHRQPQVGRGTPAEGVREIGVAAAPERRRKAGSAPRR
jgi:capsular polysaccharide biosynthesis protein